MRVICDGFMSCDNGEYCDEIGWYSLAWAAAINSSGLVPFAARRHVTYLHCTKLKRKVPHTVFKTCLEIR